MTKEEWNELANVEFENPRYDQLMAKTHEVDEHPENYTGPCLCRLCMSYADSPKDPTN